LDVEVRVVKGRGIPAGKEEEVVRFDRGDVLEWACFTFDNADMGVRFEFEGVGRGNVRRFLTASNLNSYGWTSRNGGISLLKYDASNNVYVILVEGDWKFPTGGSLILFNDGSSDGTVTFGLVRFRRENDGRHHD